MRIVRAALAVARAVRVPLALSAALVSAGCSPKVGDHCTQNTDCGSSGSLICDTSLPYGYCTQFNCTPDVCQNSAACVALEPAIPGCPYDDYHSPSRTSRTLCLAQCHSDSDCRQSDGYVCRDPRLPPWSVAILDDVQSQRTCVPAFSSEVHPFPEGGLPEGSVCSASGPALDAAIPLGPADGGSDAERDAALDGSPDGPADAASADVVPDAPADGPGEGGDAAGDGASDGPTGLDGATDAGAADAADGG